jgi:hypothetical protein
MRCDGPVWLYDSESTAPVCLEDAHIGDLAARGLKVMGNQGGHGICLCGSITSHDVDMTDARIEGTLGLVGAKISGSLTMAQMNLAPANRIALTGRLLSVGGSLVANGLCVTRGGIYMEGVNIGGLLLLAEANISNADGLALLLDHADVKLGLIAKALVAEGEVRLHHAQVSCQVNLAGSRLMNVQGDALRADHIVVNGAMLLNDMHAYGSVMLHGAKLDCTLNIYGLRVELEGEPRCGLSLTGALVDGRIIAQDVNVQGGMDLTASTVHDTVDLSGGRWEKSHRGATLRFDGGVFKGGIVARRRFECGGQVSIEDAVVDHSFNICDCEIGEAGQKSISAGGSAFRGDFLADRATMRGALDLTSCSVQGDVRLADSRLEGSPAQDSSRGSPADLRRGGRWRGTSVRLSNSNVAGSLDLRGSYVGHTIDLTSTKVGRTVDLSNTAMAVKAAPALVGPNMESAALRFLMRSGTTGAVLLNDASVGVFTDNGAAWAHVDQIAIEGFTYARLESTMNSAQRLQWLAKATSHYSPQPYEQLAESYRLEGKESDAREVRYAALRRSHGAAPALIRVSGVVQNLLIGYGYRPWRALAWAILFWLAGALYFQFAVGSCGSGAHAASGLCPINPTVHPTWDPFLYSLDLMTPLVSWGYESAWDVTGTSKIVVLLLSAVGWVLVTTIVAAVTRTLRRR